MDGRSALQPGRTATGIATTGTHRGVRQDTIGRPSGKLTRDRPNARTIDPAVPAFAGWVPSGVGPGNEPSPWRPAQAFPNCAFHGIFSADSDYDFRYCAQHLPYMPTVTSFAPHGAYMEIETLSIIGGRGRLGEPEPVERVDLRMGEVASVVGPTGSGKTELINDIERFANANTPSGRRVLVNGSAVDDDWSPTRAGTRSRSSRSTRTSSPTCRFESSCASTRRSGRELRSRRSSPRPSSSRTSSREKRLTWTAR